MNVEERQWVNQPGSSTNKNETEETKVDGLPEYAWYIIDVFGVDIAVVR